MLAVESLTDAVSFLPLYDLDSVLLANRQLSSIAYKCVKVIGAWQFEFVNFFFDENSVILYEMVMNDDGDADVGRDIEVEGRENVTGVALYNACFKVLSFFVSPDAVSRLPNKSALMVKKLDLAVKGVPSAYFLVDIIARFRKVQVVNLYDCETIPDFSLVVDLSRQKGIRRVTHNYEDLMEWR